MLRVLVVDDEAPALADLVYQLGQDPRVGTIRTASSGADALRALEQEQLDAIFLDIRMPGLTGLELAKVLARFAQAPPIVFVTAHDDHAVDAFELDVLDYLLKPVRPERLAEAVRRVEEKARATPAPPRESDDETISVELGGVTRFVQRSEVRYVEAHGDYARLHTGTTSHLVRVPLATLEERWKSAGFVRIHRRLLVSLAHVTEVRTDAGRCTVRVDGTELQVSRRHTPELRDILVRRARPGRTGAGDPRSLDK
ncbi:LytR/AlgR family response regulator transcription factor [Tenggerimyces flavus]|uniref:LytR/AlgR family response regulator transcription factor n=1 Tax=Tenggerimyces flavus TaxID=1708749 RepID=A0ABV7YBV7_9ACTN|nr:LytTR family DNA-binding domain-containing protein [Tenggerimyces flavus]MBM7783462.1 DNA-binding LytR/AlgR family response regulator [Tenggerimyces flavus]